MPSSYTASLRFEQQFTGENVNTWGQRWNVTTARIDFAIAGRAVINMTGGTYVVSSSNTADDEARAAVLALTGSGGTLRIPALTKVYRVENGGTTATVITTGSGSTVTVDAGDILDIHCDGTNVKTPGVGGLSYKQYISSVAIGTISGLPAVAGNASKVMWSDGVTAYWKTPSIVDIPDYATDQASKIATARAEAIAFAIAL